MPASAGSSRPGPSLGAARGWRRRLLFHHVPLAVASGAGMAAFIGLAPSHGAGISISHWVVASGYVAVTLLAFTLLIGPTNLLLRKRNPISSYLRRDIGAWTAILSIVHVVLGFETHDVGTLSGILDFFFVDGAPLTTHRGLGNWTGLAATVIVVGLLTISTDRSIRELRGPRWKDLQRLNYTLFALVVLHAVFYGALGRPTSPLTLLLVFTVTTVLVGQAIGVSLWRRRQAERQARRTRRAQASSQAQVS